MEIVRFTKINKKQTKATDAQGRRYKAKATGASCPECAFSGTGWYCSYGDTYCTSSNREDGRSIIWKPRKAKP